jgi:GntR family transcriptional regulator/MocR family aminotransferase
LVTPARQFPTGVPLSRPRRQELLDWARREQGWVIEDDFESDFCFAGRLPAALASEAEGGERVAYMSTFATTMFPALRVAYLIAPDALIDRILAARAASDRTMSVPLQMVLQDFMEQGHLAAHVRACRDVYAERRATLVDALQGAFGRECEIAAPEVGLHALLWLKENQSDRALRDAARAQNVIVSPIADHAILPARPGLFLGFAPFTPASIRRAVEGLRTAYEKYERAT